MTARSHSRLLRRPPQRRSIRAPQREPFSATGVLNLKPPRQAPTLADVWPPDLLGPPRHSTGGAPCATPPRRGVNGRATGAPKGATGPSTFPTINPKGPTP